ncbi:MAG TPA: hypothetical protein VFV19_19425 [Candidatus Polarisedimenticolaceae bacterium]|nr:hypothetical protein [Candidatus Polarisedimenticolaceae bacterium]
MRVRILIALAIVAFSTLCVAADDAAILADFKAFAAKEAPRIQSEFSSLLTRAGRRSGMLVGRIMVIGGFDGMLTRYAIDLRRTDSLVSPFVGTIEIYGRSFGDRAGEIYVELTPYRVTYAQQEGKWVIDSDSATPNAAMVHGKEKRQTLSQDWLPYASGETDTPPGPLPE